MHDIIRQFESIGDNCEFGFVQRHHQFETGGLLRWALVTDSSALIKGIRTRFDGIFQFENLAPAGGGTMVMDTHTGIAFHTHMTSTEQNGSFVFEKSEAERREIHADEAGKLDYLVDKFLATLSEGEKILVFKQNRIVPLEVAQEILASVQIYGDCSVLFVDPQQDNDTAGSVERLSNNLYRGVIDKFAPYHLANEVSFDVWSEICVETARLHSVIA